MKVLVVNGPNLNMLGIREKHLYGTETYEKLLECIGVWSGELGIETDVFQSNHEGAIVDRIQQALGVYDGIVINPAAYTHTSVAILDALKAVDLPCCEVHLTDISKREPFRQVSFAGMACEKHFIGMGFEGYRAALEWLAERKK